MGLASQTLCSDFGALPTLEAHQELLLRAHTDEPRPWLREMCTCVSAGRFQGAEDYCTTFIAFDWGGKCHCHLDCCLAWVCEVKSDIAPVQTPKGAALSEHRASSEQESATELDPGDSDIHMGSAQRHSSPSCCVGSVCIWTAHLFPSTVKHLLMTGTTCGLYTSRDCNLSIRELSQEDLGRCSE